jgi:hypothetical protein
VKIVLFGSVVEWLVGNTLVGEPSDFDDWIVLGDSVVLTN